MSKIACLGCGKQRWCKTQPGRGDQPRQDKCLRCRRKAESAKRRGFAW